MQTHCGRNLWQKGKKLDVWRIGLGCIAFLQSWSLLYPSLSKTWQTEFGTSCAPTYLVTPNSNDYDVRLFLDRMEMLRCAAYVDAAVKIPFVANSDDDGIVSHELEKIRSILEESMLETRSMPLENRPKLPRISLSKRNRAVALNQPVTALRDGLNSFWRRTGSMPYYWRQTSRGWTCYSKK
ncbi:unnamed protein product [Parnassius apollo]|uniref:(apollo) hypothetical protein n=1 Tax=Parnassius apollo TaxID=110799 RepID=A0A8S3XM27_PARAO|nr:unnamed protein product [Parnassius apollo]